MRETVIFVLAITALSWIPYQINAGTSSFYRKEPITQILFILDGSGSMKAGWEGTTRFEIAKRLLVQTIDSIEKANQNVRFALRVFGHQYPKSENNCKDSKLEVAFAANNADKIRRKLDLVHPQGWTPIAYSIFNSMNDFPILNQGGVHNIIILITDGVENCEGDPCAIGEELLKRGIVLKPFIIGLGMDMEDIAKFDCVGQFYDAADREAFANTLDIVVSQALHNTTAQVNLLDDYGNPTQTNVEMTFYNAFTDEIEYNFVHTMISPGVPDTIPINPVGKYNLVVHTIPPTFKYNIELTPGRHNIIPVDVPQGILSISMDRFAGSEEFQCLIRQAGSPQTLTLQDINSKQNYLVGSYDIEVLTLPRVRYYNVELSQSTTQEINIPKPGKLNLNSRSAVVASIFSDIEGIFEKVIEFEPLHGRTSVNLQPGNYVLVYREVGSYESASSESKKFIIRSGAISNIEF